MEFDWDEEKDVANRAKHGVGLGDAVRLEWEEGQFRPDRRFNYGEERQEVLANLNGRLCSCIYTMRGHVFRVISLRKANRREQRRYDQSR